MHSIAMYSIYIFGTTWLCIFIDCATMTMNIPNSHVNFYLIFAFWLSTSVRDQNFAFLSVPGSTVLQYKYFPHSTYHPTGKMPTYTWVLREKRLELVLSTGVQLCICVSKGVVYMHTVTGWAKFLGFCPLYYTLCTTTSSRWDGTSFVHLRCARSLSLF